MPRKLSKRGNKNSTTVVTLSMRDFKGQARKWKKKIKKMPCGLSHDDIAFLMKKTNYEKEEIIDWYHGFMTDCPTGKMDRKKIESMYSMVLPLNSAKAFVNQIFKVFDEDGDGTIDFKVKGVSVDLWVKHTIFLLTQSILIYLF